MSTLADKWAEHASSADPRRRIEDKRQFMAGALAALVLHGNGVDRAALLAECIGFGRAIGTPAELAGPPKEAA